MKRRNFVQSLTAAALGAASYRRVQGANGRIGLGLIGAGRRGTLVAQSFLQSDRVELRSICDIYDKHRSLAKTTLLPHESGVLETEAHEEVLSRNDVDAVLIAAPDHLHLSLAQAALSAGKHVYLEKPTIHRWAERDALQTATQKAGKVLQCGMQQRSGSHYIQAKEEVFNRHQLGEVVLVRATWSNFPWQQRHIQSAPKPPALDWNRFLGPARHVSYDAARYDAWRYFPDYGGGLLADILTHWADVAQWMLADSKPLTATASGGIYSLKDGRQNPDTVNAVIRYSGWNLSFESSVLSIGDDNPSVLFEGTAGSLNLARDGYTWTPKKGNPIRVDAAGTLERAHTQNFIDAIQTGKRVSAPLPDGIDACRPVQMALQSYWEQRIVHADSFTGLPAHAGTGYS